MSILYSPFAFLALTAAAGAQTFSIVVLDGDSVPGIGSVTSIENLDINEAGDWLVEVDTDHPDNNADGVILRNGSLVLREGDSVLAPSGATIDFFDSVRLNDLGNRVHNHTLDGTSGSSDDSASVNGFEVPS